MHTNLKKVIDMTKPKQHDTLKDALIHKMKGLVKGLALVAISFLAVHWLVGGQGIITATPGELPSQTQVDRAPTQSLAEKVLEQHKDECWTGSQQPKADLPGAAIVQFSNGMVQYTTVHWKVDAAFNEALANIGFGDKVSKKLDPIALCI